MSDVMIKAEHMSMVFNLNKSHTTSLKEYMVKLLKRELKYETFTAVNDVSFEIQRGDIVGIIGTNGSGKSTILKMISGIYKPSSGSCVTYGRIAPMLELGSGFDFELSGRDNIYLNGTILGFSLAFLQEKFDEIVDFAEIREFIDQPLKTYSSGMMMRLAFSVATLVNPEILIVDEILAVGDDRFQQKSLARMMELIHSGTTVLMVSHDMNTLRSICTRAIWLDHGHLLMDGDAETVCSAYMSR